MKNKIFQYFSILVICAIVVAAFIDQFGIVVDWIMIGSVSASAVLIVSVIIWQIWNKG